MSLRKIIDIDESKCDGCGQCVPACAEGAIKIVNGKAKLVADAYCDGLGACLGECPQDAIRIIEREAQEFDEILVKNAGNHSPAPQIPATLLNLAMPSKSLHAQAAVSRPSHAVSHSGCPGMAIQSFLTPNKDAQHGGDHAGHSEDARETEASALANWPVQLHLVPPHAPFLQGADLLLAADCVPAAMPDFHRRILRGRPLLIGCPKLDDTRAYIEKLAAIFSIAQPRRVTVVHMEVPCCTALMRIAVEAQSLAGSNIPLEEAVVSRQGKALKSH